jgi:FemAB-related protein (PEP-CTERM system-associated)
MLLIKSYSERYRQQWDGFVMNSETASLFHLTGWKDAVGRVFDHKPHYLMAVNDEKICGILPLFEMKSRFFGHALVSVPFGVEGGISADDEDSYLLLKSSAENLANLIGVHYLELRQPNIHTAGNDNSNALNNSGWISKDLYVSFRRPIFATVDENFNAIPRKQRRMIRQGEKYGLRSRTAGSEDLEKFYHIYAGNVRDLGSPVYPLSFFKTLMETFSDSFILSVWKDDRMVAGVLNFVFKDVLMPYYGGSRRDCFQYAVNDFMYWELMKYGCEKGCKVFDFGRSKKDTGPYHFKRHWGFEPQGFDYRYYLVRAKKMPNVSPANPKYRLFINAWKRLPLPVTNWLGPKLVKGIP